MQLTSLRGQTVRFGWTGAFLVDGAEQPLAGYPHIDGPYGQAALPATDLDILYLEYRLRLNLVATRPTERN